MTLAPAAKFTSATDAIERPSVSPPGVARTGVRWASAVVARSYLTLAHRLRIDGRHRLPGPDRSFVMVANHASHLDASCLLAALPIGRLTRAYPCAAADLFYASPARSAASDWLFNGLPMRRTRCPNHALDRCRRVLDRPGSVLVLFPEGTRSDGGDLGPFRAGVGMLLAATDVPCVPCHIDGAAAAWPKVRSVPRPSGVRVTIGEPLAFAGVARTPDGYRSVAATLRATVEAIGANRECPSYVGRLCTA